MGRNGVLIGVEHGEVGGGALGHLMNHSLRQGFGSGSTIRKMGTWYCLYAALRTGLYHNIQLLVRVGVEAVDGHHRGETVAPNGVQVPVQVGHALGHRIGVWQGEFLQAHAAVHLQSADGGHDHNTVGTQTGLTALDVHELLSTQVRAKTRLGACLGSAAARSPSRKKGSLKRFSLAPLVFGLVSVNDIGCKSGRGSNSSSQIIYLYLFLVDIALEKMLHGRRHRLPQLDLFWYSYGLARKELH